MADTSLTLSIQNDVLSVCIAACGAEMQSVKCGGLERLWCGDPAIWGRHAPLLFPLIGRLRGGCYALDGRLISAPMHGFCRERLFEAEQVSASAVRFSTRFDEETLRVYPFEFALSVTYELQGNTLVKTHCVTNNGTAPMPFELGGHEAYATCLLPGEHTSDYFVRFEGLESLEAYTMDGEGILSVPKRTIPLNNGCLTQTPEQLGLDTVVVENVPGNVAVLGCAKSEHEVRVEFPGFPYLGIWTKPVGAGNDARYLCIEPWSALPDAHFSSRELAEKPGVRVIAPGKSVELAYRMTFR